MKVSFSLDSVSFHGKIPVHYNAVLNTEVRHSLLLRAMYLWYKEMFEGSTTFSVQNKVKKIEKTI